MKIIDRRYKYATIVFVLSMGLSALAGQAQTLELIELCDFEVPRAISNANITFSVIYLIEIGPTGSPIKVTRVKNDFLADDPFVNCFRDWVLLPDHGPVSIILNWKHGIGWTQMSLSGGGYRRVLKFQPGWCASGIEVGASRPE
jgi:hypothetical protein